MTHEYCRQPAQMQAIRVLCLSHVRHVCIKTVIISRCVCGGVSHHCQTWMQVAVCGRRKREGEGMFTSPIKVLYIVNSSLNLPVSSLTLVQCNLYTSSDDAYLTNLNLYGKSSMWLDIQSVWFVFGNKGILEHTSKSAIIAHVSCYCSSSKML